MLSKIASSIELQAELRKLLAYAESPNPSRAVLARGLDLLGLRLAGDESLLQKMAQEKMDQEKLIPIFDSLKPRQRIKVTIKAVMGYGKSETGTPTEYIVGRRTQSRGTTNLQLLPADGSKPHPMRKVTLYKRNDYQGTPFVSVALGDMGATLVSIET